MQLINDEIEISFTKKSPGNISKDLKKIHIQIIYYYFILFYYLNYINTARN